jgi:hypothetical protein
LPPANERGTDAVEIGSITAFPTKTVTPVKEKQRHAQMFFDAESDLEPVASKRAPRRAPAADSGEEIEYSSDDEEEQAPTRQRSIPMHAGGKSVSMMEARLADLSRKSNEAAYVRDLEKKIAAMEAKLQDKRLDHGSDTEDERTDPEDAAACTASLAKAKKRVKKYVDDTDRVYYAVMYSSIGHKEVKSLLQAIVTSIKVDSNNTMNKRNVKEIDFLVKQLTEFARVLADDALVSTTRYRVVRMAQLAIEELVAALIRVKSDDNAEVAKFEKDLATEKERVVKKKTLVLPYAKWVAAAPLGRPKTQGGRFGHGQRRNDGRPPAYTPQPNQDGAPPANPPSKAPGKFPARN